MNFKLLQGYSLAILATLILVAGGFILINNLGDHWPLHLFWKTVTMSRSTWLLLAGVAGAIVWWTVRKLLPRSVSLLRAGSRLRRERQAQRQLKDLSRRSGNDQAKP